MERLLKKEISVEPKRFRMNPFSRLEAIFRERNLRTRERELQLRVAILSGSIKRVK
jgi:hypothetical protein